MPASLYGLYLGRNANTASITDTSVARKLWPVDVGGIQLEGQPEVNRLQTLHLAQGSAYSFLNRRNANAGTINGSLFPELASTILHAAGTNTSLLASDGKPYRHQIVEYFGQSLGVDVSGNSSSDIGQDKRGVVFNGFSMSLDRDGGGVVTASLSGYVNADYALGAVSSTTSDAESAGSSKVLTLASSTGFVKGDVVLITDGGTGNPLTKTIITAISGNDVTVASLSAGISGTTTVARSIPDAASDRPEAELYPYPTTSTYIDFDLDVAGWSGDNSDVQSVSLQFDQALTPKTFRPSSTAELNQTWSDLSQGIPTLSGTVVLKFGQDEYANIKRATGVRTAALRILATHPNSSGNTTTSAGETAGSSVTVAVAATSGFAVNDYVLLNDGTNQAVAKVTTVNAGVSLVIDTLDVDLSSGATVTNCAWEIKIPQVDITSAPITQSGDDTIVTVNFEAVVTATTTSLLSVKAYDDDNT